MFHHAHNFLHLTSLIAVLAGLATVGSLRAAEHQAKAVPTGRADAEKHATAVKNEKRQPVAKKLVQFQAELERLQKLYTANHPRIKRVAAQVREFKDATERNREAESDRRRREIKARQQSTRARENHLNGRHEQEPERVDQRQGRNHDLPKRARMRHVQQAIEHLHAADLHDLAEMIGVQSRSRLHERGHDDQSGLQRELREREHDDGHEQGSNDKVWRVLGRLGQAVQNIERRVHESAEIRRSVEDIHRNVRHMQRELELRFREIEQAVKHHVRDVDRFVEEHSGEFEQAIENIERHVERQIGEFEQRLDGLHEQCGQDEHGDGDDDDDGDEDDEDEDDEDEDDEDEDDEDDDE